jgi:hypothetical protein
MGKCPVGVSSVTVIWRCTTKAALVTWAEIAIATGSVNFNGNSTLTVQAFTDISAKILGTGVFTTVVTVTLAQNDDVWILIGNAVTGAAGVVRAATVADDLQIGYQASKASRPSTIVGSPNSFTLEGATILPVLLGISY